MKDYDTLYSTNHSIETDRPNNGDGNRNGHDCAVALGANGPEFIIGAISGIGDYAFAKFGVDEAILIRDALDKHIKSVRAD